MWKINQRIRASSVSEFFATFSCSTVPSIRGDLTADKRLHSLRSFRPKFAIANLLLSAKRYVRFCRLAVVENYGPVGNFMHTCMSIQLAHASCNLNPRPPPCQGGDLPADLPAHCQYMLIHS